MKPIRASLLGFLVSAAISLSAYAADPSGTWKFTATGPNGHTGESTLTLNYANAQLTGTMDNRAGKVAISDATFGNDEVAFRVHREIGRRLRKKAFDVQYHGKLQGDTISGTIQITGRQKEPVTLQWEAHRVK